MRFAQRLTELRLAKKQSLQQVADAVGVSKAHVWEMEKGRAANPSMALVTRLADHFRVSVTYLVGEDPTAPDEDDQLVRMFRQAKDLEPRDRDALDALLQSFLSRQGKSTG